MERVKRKKGDTKALGTLTLSENIVCFGEIYQIYMKWHHSLMLYFLWAFNKFFPMYCKLILLLCYYPNTSFLTLFVVYYILVFP